MGRLSSQTLACLLLLLAAWSGFAVAGGLTPGAGSVDLSHHSQFVVGDGKLTPDQVQDLPESRWQGLDKDINLGYTDAPHWFRVRLENSHDEPLRRLIELGYPMLDRIDFFTVQDGNLVKQASTGDSLAFDTRPTPHRAFVFPVTLAPETTNEFYFLIQTSGSLQLPLTLWQADAFASHSDAELTMESMFYGIMLVMALFNLFLFFSLRERAYLYYVGVVSSTLVLMASLDGVAFQYLYPDLPALHKQVLLVIVPLCQVALCLFAREYLELQHRYPLWNRLFLVLAAVAALGAITSFVLPFNLSTRLTVSLAIPVALANLVAGISLWRRGDKNARLFSIAWVALLASVLLTVLNKLGLLPTSLLTEHGIPLGASAQALLFSFALADRFNRERRAYFHEKQLALAAVQQQREAEAALLRASSHHELTGLPDRSIFERVVDRAISGNAAAPSAVFMLHLRRFDDINKTLGHKDADQMLNLFACRMNRLVAGTVQAVYLEGNGDQTKCVAHIEGVSFAFALQDDDHQRLLEQAAELAERFAEPIEFRGLMLELSFVIGASFVEPEVRDTQSLLRHAFIALDQTGAGGSNLAVYNAEMNPYSPRRLTLMTDLREALRSDGLELYFQPQLQLKSDRIAGFEALLRWAHPEHGFVPPDEFIPMAEQTGLIKPVTQWVIREALSFCKALDDVGCDATVSVNISAMNLREPDFCDAVCRLLENNHVAARRLVLEVTETAAMLDPQRSLSALSALQAAKVRLSIDDFGTGHSSLAYIRKLPVNEIKIDRSFVMAMDTNAGDATIVRTTINMCHDLGYEVVAEGVENKATLELLRRFGCDYAQGYHLARPMNIDNALAWLRQSSLVKHSGLSA
ncbi:MAG: EAL domain-containing protein [Marinobacter sp.]|uniref:EAL domain-containing protein n=1 Tax=Marinobacter sp. TaxID=50741 RepID=UPI00299EAE8C|nr:EAL domain-containing protein [Marinobacter sp.]MDX1634214.1 EAL domain-containing protein [Marinobacter sp.]